MGRCNDWVRVHEDVSPQRLMALITVSRRIGCSSLPMDLAAAAAAAEAAEWKNLSQQPSDASVTTSQPRQIMRRRVETVGVYQVSYGDVRVMPNSSQSLHPAGGSGVQSNDETDAQWHCQIGEFSQVDQNIDTCHWFVYSFGVDNLSWLFLTVLTLTLWKHSQQQNPSSFRDMMVSSFRELNSPYCEIAVKA